MEPFITAYGPKNKTSITFEPTGKTKQAHQDETDINQIMQKFVKTGILEHAEKHQAQYGFATSADLHTSLNTLQRAQDMFDDLPSAVRKKFHNDPGEFLDFVQDPANADQMYDLGLSDVPPDIEPEIPIPAEIDPPTEP